MSLVGFAQPVNTTQTDTTLSVANTVNLSNLGTISQDTISPSHDIDPAFGDNDLITQAWDDWIDISSFDQEQQRIIVGDTVHALAQQMLYTPSEYPNFQESDILFIHEKWQREKDLFDTRSVQRLFDLEVQLSSANQIYQSHSTKVINLGEEIEKKRNEKSIMEKQIKHELEQVEYWGEWIEQNENLFRTRLASLPQSMVLIGMAPTGEKTVNGDFVDYDPEIVKQTIIDHLTHSVVNNLLPERYISYYSSDNNINYTKYLRKDFGGTVQVSDNYSGEIQETIRTDNSTPLGVTGTYRYLILRFDFFPFDRERATSIVSPGQNAIDVHTFYVQPDTTEFKLLSQNISIRRLADSTSFTLRDIALIDESIETQTYQMAKTVLENNRRVMDMISNIYYDFTRRDSLYKSNLQDHILSKSTLDSCVADLEQDISQLLEVEYEAGLNSKEHHQRYLEALQTYNDSSRSEIALFSEFRVFDSQPIDNFRLKAMETYDAIQTYRRKNIMKTLDVSRTDSGELVLVRTSREETYYAQVTEFKPFYVSQMVGDSRRARIFIGYRLLYTSQEDGRIDEANNSFIQLSKGLEWKTTDNIRHSYIMKGPVPSGTGWRLPTIEELESLQVSVVSARGRQDIDPFESLGWDKYAYLSSEQQFMHEGTSYVQAYSFYPGNIGPIEIQAGASVCILWVRETSEDWIR